ncbi:hypothetical protein ANO11243_018310 [Dothideomycetidae sp. 11243]|nr:hypothetical protein ANO11243_018310 [fungal sp. No.11243]
MPRNRLDGCACKSPLAHFYIHHSESSARELHPFTTITHLASHNDTHCGSYSEDYTSIPIQFLFRKRGKTTASVPMNQSSTPSCGCITLVSHLMSKSPKTSNSTLQWTDRLAGVAKTIPTGNPVVFGGESSPEGLFTSAYETTPTTYQPSSGTLLRLEGPYFTPSHPDSYDTVICLVAGTGVSGALAISSSFAAAQHSYTNAVQRTRNGFSEEELTDVPTTPHWRRCVIVWSVRESDYIDLCVPFPYLSGRGIQVVPHITGGGQKRMDTANVVQKIVRDDRDDGQSAQWSTSTSAVIPTSTLTPPAFEVRAGTVKPISEKQKQKVWVYISGPSSFIENGEEVCKVLGVDYYGARWDV